MRPPLFIGVAVPLCDFAAAVYRGDDDMIIHSYENGLRADACIEYLRGAPSANFYENIILLPIPSSRDNKTILNTKVCINELVDALDGGTAVSGYGLPDSFVKAGRDKGALIIDLSYDEQFLLENAELTALAALGIYLGSTKCSLRDTSVGIVGYGRIGKKLTAMLLYLGADVKVFTSRENMRLDLCECGVATAKSSKDADLCGLDVLINTAPAVIFAPDAIPDGLRIIDLASGENFPGMSGVEKYPSIPAKMFPKSAGRAWGRAVERYLSKKQ